jgi:hypothetical protein
MNRATTFDSLDREELIGVALAQAEAIERQGEAIAALRAEIAGLRGGEAGSSAQDAGQLEHSPEPGTEEDDRVRQEPAQEETASGRASAVAS